MKHDRKEHKLINIPVTLFCDTNHIMQSDYAQIRIIGAGADAVDFVLINAYSAGDIVVTQDYIVRTHVNVR